MEASQSGAPLAIRSQTHPLLLAAAASVTLLSLAGVGTLAGWLPGPGARTATTEQRTASPLAMPAAPRSATAKPAAAPKPAPAPLATSDAAAPTEAQREKPAPATPRPEVAVPPAPTFHAATLPVAATPPPEVVHPVATTQAPVCEECGVVEAVREIVVEAEASGGGAIAGGLLGGLLANQVGKGSGKTVATVLGAAGGAWAGHAIEKRVRTSKRYEVVVRFDDGSTRSFNSDTPPAWRSGDRVRLQNGLLTMGGGRSTGTPGMV